MSERQVKTRLTRLLGGLAVRADDPAVRVAHGVKFRIDDPDWLDALVRALTGRRRTIVILDSLRGVLGSVNENDAAQVRDVLDRLRAVAEFGHVIIVIGHEQKPARSMAAKHATSGSTDIYNDQDVVIRFEFDKPPQPIKLSVTKARDHAEDRGPWFIQVRDVDQDALAVSSVETGVGSPAAVADDKALQAAIEAVLRAGAGLMSRNAVRGALPASFRPSYPELNAALRTLASSGVVIEEKKSGLNAHPRYRIAKS